MWACSNCRHHRVSYPRCFLCCHGRAPRLAHMLLLSFLPLHSLAGRPLAGDLFGQGGLLDWLTGDGSPKDTLFPFGWGLLLFSCLFGCLFGRQAPDDYAGGGEEEVRFLPMALSDKLSKNSCTRTSSGSTQLLSRP